MMINIKMKYKWTSICHIQIIGTGIVFGSGFYLKVLAANLSSSSSQSVKWNFLNYLYLLNWSRVPLKLTWMLS